MSVDTRFLLVIMVEGRPDVVAHACNLSTQRLKHHIYGDGQRMLNWRGQLDLSSINSGGAEGNLVLYAKTLIKISAP
jgi:hypothetical protein